MAKVQILEEPLNELERFFEAGLKVELTEIDRQKEQLTINHERTYYLQKEKDLELQKLKRQANLQKFNKELKTIENKYEVIKNFDDDENQRLEEYIDQKTEELKARDQFQEFIGFLQGYFEDSRFDGNDDINLTEEEITTIKEEFKEKSERAKNQFKIHFDIFNEVIESLKQICDTEKFKGQLEKVSTELQIDKDELSKRINPKIIRSNTDIEKEASLNELEDIEDKGHFILVSESEDGCSADETNYGNSEERHKEKYQEIVQEYQQKYQCYTKEQIREYGENTKNQIVGYAYDDVSSIAAIIRANEISTGHCLRKIQILAILEFLADKNKFCQIDTGEGKTTITSALAVISTLRGETVDIITSNQVLAEDAVRERGDFYNLFGISVTHNNPDLNNPYVEGLKECYTHDVVYGTIGAFAFDYLHNSVEALGTKVLHMKNGIPVIRECDTVIIDEADNVILDNYALMTNQAKSVAGVDQIKFIYIDIWQKIIKAEKELCIDQLNITDKDKKALKEQINKKEIEAKIDQDERIQYFLKERVKRKLDLLIDNAIKAKYDLHVDEDYVINKKDDEDNILPLEKDIGVRLQNFIWTDLHPFLQMKHNLHVNSCGSLTSVFIPNCGYLKLYKKIYGLTGTLGSSKEQEFTKNIFGVDSTIIPAFKQNQRKHIKEKMCKDENEWLDCIADVSEEIEQRAVLFVCDTPNAVKKIEQKLKECGYKDITIYENESDAYKIENINKSGGVTQNKIIISTNIGGRGTDIKLSTDVEINGGLHEVTTYLPRNQRTQKQAAGRAARSGQPGSNQIIFQQSEVSELEKLLPENVLMELNSKYNQEYLQKVISAGVGLNKLRDDIKLQLSSTKLNGIPIAIQNELISADEQSQQEEIIESTDFRKEAREFVLLSSESIELSVNTYAFALRDKVEELRLEQAELHLNNLLKQYQLFKKFENYYYYLKKYKQINHFILEDLKLKFGLCYDEVDKTNWDNFFQEIDSDIKTDYVQYKFANSNYAIKYAQSLIRSGEFDQARQFLSGDKLCTNITDLFPGVIDDFYKNAYNQRNNRLYLYQAGDFCTLQKQIFSKYQDVKTLVLDNGKNKSIYPSGNSYTNDLDIEIAKGNLGEQLQDLSVPKLVYYNISNEHWVCFATIEYEGQLNILYKDSLGNGNDELKKEIEEIITGKAVNFIYNRTKEQTEGVECGIFALENMRIIAEKIASNRDSFIKDFENFSDFCNLDQAIKFRREDFANKFVLGKYQQMVDSVIISSKLKVIRKRHFNEAQIFATKLKEFSFAQGNDLEVIALSDDEVLEPRKNIIAIQIATNSGITDPVQEGYEYYYHIIFSTDLSSERVNEIIDNIERELHITFDRDSKNFKAREVIGAIGFNPISPEAILDNEISMPDIKKDIKINDLLDNLYVPHQSASTVIKLLQSDSSVTRGHDQDDYEGEFDILPAYHFAMFEIEISKGFNVFYRLLEGITSISLDSNAQDIKCKKNAISHLNKAKTLLQKRLKEITQLIDFEEFREICLSKEDQEYNFGDNMMQRHLESEQSLIIATIAHAEELARLIESNLDDNKQIVLKKTYSFKQIIENSLEIDLSIDGMSKSEIALADSVGLGVYYEIEVLANLGSNDSKVKAAVKAARLKIAGGAAMLLLAYIPQTRIVTPAIAIPAGKLIRRGTKKLLSLIFNDPNIDDEVDDIEDYVLDIATSFAGPATVVPKILKTVLMQVGQSFLVNYLIKNFGKELLDIIKDKFGGPIKALIEEPLRKIYEWKESIFSQLKEAILDPVKEMFQWLLGKAKDVMDEISSTLSAKSRDEFGSTDMQESILDKIQKVKKFLFEIIEDITWVKDKLFRGFYDSLDIFNQFKKIKKFISFFSDFKKGLIKAIKSLTGVIKGFVEGDLLESIKTIITRVKDIVESIITSIPQYIERIVNQAKDLYVLIKEIINTITRDPIGFFRWLINYMPAFIQAEIFNKGYDLLANIMRGIMSKIEEIFDSIFRNNPIDKFLNKYGIDLSNPGTMINKICSYAVDMIIGFVKSMIFQPPKQVNEDGVESSHNAVDEAVHKSTRSQQCVPFSLTKLFNISEEELLNVTRTYISTKITADQGLTDWQTKFIIEDLGLKVFKENKDQESQYATIAIQYLKNCSSVGGIGLFVRLDKRGHAYFISETESVRFIDEANPEGVIDLTTEDYTKGTFLIPMNFSQNRRSEISKRIKENPNPNDSFVFMFWLRRIWEKLFPGQTFGANLSLIQEGNYPSGVIEVKLGDKHSAEAIFKLQDELSKRIKNAESVNNLGQKDFTKKKKYIKDNIPVFDCGKGNLTKDEMMLGALTVKFSNGKLEKFLAASGDRQIFIRENQPFTFSYNNFTFINPAQSPTNQKIINLLNGVEEETTWNKSCAAQKLFYHLGNLQKKSCKTIKELTLYETFYSYGAPTQGNRKHSQIFPVKSCDYCKHVLPIATAKPHRGLGGNKLYNIEGVNSFFYEYTMEGIRDILGLRLSAEYSTCGLTNTLILAGTYIFSEKRSNIHALLFYLNLYFINMISQRNKYAMNRVSLPVILAPISLYDKHAVGVMFVDQEDGSGYKAFYLDPENITISEGLATIFKDNGYELEQLPTEGQRYTNCGPEVIENFMLYLTGERLSQEDAIINNSKLVEQELLTYGVAIEEGNSLSIKDIYRKQDTVNAISNTGYNTQVSSDGYAIGNPTKYDIFTPQTIIDGVVVRAGEVPRDILIELLNDYRMIQNYAESILGEVGSIDIS